MTQPSANLLPPDAVTSHHAPHATWTVGGAFRYDEHLLTMVAFLASFYPPRAISSVAGVPPCAWSLEHPAQLRPMLSMPRYRGTLRAYAETQVGMVLVFDNPQLPADSLNDEYAHRLVELLLTTEYNPTKRNAVCVAHDGLAQTLRERYPSLPVICHPNRLIVSTAKRTPAFYAGLEKLYTQIILHPRDAVSPALFTRLSHAERYGVVLNDPTPRNYPVRRELLHLLAEIHRSPWNSDLRRALDRMERETDLRAVENTCNLTRQEEAALYAAGVRRFVVQSSCLRNEITLYYDLFFHMLRTVPELSNKAALIAGAAMAHIRPSEDDLPGGLSLFQTVE